MSTFVLLTITGPRARRDVLPDRLRPLADLRADGRPQLRARRVPHRRRLRDVVDRRRSSAAIDRSGCASSSAPSSGSPSARVVAALVELVLIRPLYRRHIEQVLVTVGLALALIALVAGDLGRRPAAVPGAAAGSIDTTSVARRARSRTTASSRSPSPAVVLVGLQRVPALHALRADHPRRRREPRDGDRARDRRAQGVHARLRDRRRRGRARRRALGRLLRRRRPEPRHLAPDLRLHRRRDRRPRLDRRLGGRRGRSSGSSSSTRTTTRSTGLGDSRRRAPARDRAAAHARAGSPAEGWPH